MIRQAGSTLTVLAALAGLAFPAGADDTHWSRQFPAPADISKMAPNTGMANAPRIERAKWHDGKLYMAGNWPANFDPSTGEGGNRWVWMWSWSPGHGYESIAHWGLPEGGAGPNGRIHDFLWLPDGRLVVGGEFQVVDNPGGTRWFRVEGLAVYDPAEPTADRWKPLGESFQYQGTVVGPVVRALAYDPQSESLYIGGGFPGIPVGSQAYSPCIHRLDMKTGFVEPMFPGVRGGSGVNRIVVDTRTKPSTIYVGGEFLWTAGNGRMPTLSENETTGRFSVGLAAYQEGSGWTTFPSEVEPGTRSGSLDVWSITSLRPATGFLGTKVAVNDILLDGDDLWIVGAFAAGTKGDRKVQGIAKWDAASEMWVDPTGKGGVGRDVYSIARADDGKIYFAGAFGGRTGSGDLAPGFLDGDPAHMAIRFDPASGTWEQLGSGLASGSIGECRLAVDGNDVYYLGDFHHIGGERTGKGADDKAWESSYIARWNSTIDFTKNSARVSAEPTRTAFPAPAKPLSEGNEHWSRSFPELHPISNRTGMTGSEGNVSAVVAHEGTIYFSGRWPRPENVNWFVWSYHEEKGWKELAWKGRGDKGAGVQSPPNGLRIHGGKLYAFGAIESHHGIGVYDLAAGTWGEFRGKTESGEDVVGNGMPSGGFIHDMAFAANGDVYLLGGHKVPNPHISSPASGGPVIRVDRDGLYHTMGWAFGPIDPGKPTLGYECILLDETKDPVDVYVGGTWGYCGPVPFQRSRISNNVARWNHQTGNWDPIGKGHLVGISPIDKEQYFPEGYPGLPGAALRGSFISNGGFPWVRSLALDGEGNLYAGGTFAVMDDAIPLSDRRESFGIARWNRKTDRWEPIAGFRGFSGHVNDLTFLDDRRLLVTGNFDYDARWRPLHNVAILDVAMGEVSPLGGGLMRALSDTNGSIGSEVVHCVDGEDLWFAGFFEFAGIRGNDPLEAPVVSFRVARWNATRNFDPNVGLVVSPPRPIPRPRGMSSQSVSVALAVEYSGPGKVIWYERRQTGEYAKKGEGLTYKANLRLSASSPEPVLYVAVTTPDGVVGGKIAVRIPFE